MNRHVMLKSLLLVVVVGCAVQAYAAGEGYMVLVSATPIDYEGTPAWEYYYDVYANGNGSASQIRIGGFDAAGLLNPLNQRWDSSAAYGWGENYWGEFPSIGDGDPEGTDQWVLTGNVGAMLNPLHSPSEYLDIGAMMYTPSIDGNNELQYWYGSFERNKIGLYMTIRLVHPLAPGEINYSICVDGWDQWRSPITGPAPPVPGDFDGVGGINDIDIDLLADAIRTSSVNFSLFDISADGTTGGQDGAIDILDLDFLVRFLVDTTMGAGTGSEYGDFNLDGLIDTTDLTRLATYFGPGTTWAEGNANRNIDLTIDTTDLTILGTYYGFDASVDVIPEPASAVLLLTGALAVLRRRRA